MLCSSAFGRTLIGVILVINSVLPIFARDSSVARPNPRFSGVYKPNLEFNGEDYTASFLISKDRFISSERVLAKVNASTGGEGVSTCITRRNVPWEGEKCEKCNEVMSRDYLDFMVEHMSSTTNQLDNENSQQAQKILQNLRKSTYKLKTFPPRREKDARLEQTIGVIVYSSKSVAVAPSVFQKKSRKYFMQSTFYSVYRYFPNVAIFVDSEEEFQIVGNMSLPLWNMFRIPPIKNYAFHLMKYSLVYALDQMKADTLTGLDRKQNEWSQFKYLYFTECDQILHMRNPTDIFNVVDYKDGYTMMLPHRMETLNMLKTLPWLGQTNNSAVNDILMNTVVHVENSTEATGSCCDNGRYLFGDCGNWWYYCPNWGKVSLHYWMQFDRTGLTMPLITEHQGNCIYSPTRQQCSVPGECKYRTLPVWNELREDEKKTDYFCKEMPLVQRIGKRKEG